ncbi:cupin domain-containing protein [Glycomyces terrestris]|uniref:Cupin domain-containing protein n=1 Tax=Glycomyces terrestris TaxID=2493553 RepID=A0A426UXT7_9ACTN|nr:cupin domain-containing protein [Glycomyces terrestris]RRR99379.1 cupin domain-containing protein [Glycomyces terrestris]
MSIPETFEPALRGRTLAPPGSGIVLAEWEAEGAADGERLEQAPLHRHGEDEAWYVLEGVLGVRIGDEEVEVPAGGAAIVPGGTAHTYWNPRPEPARYLLVMGPKTNALINAIHAAADRGPDAMRRLFEEHDAELLA